MVRVLAVAGDVAPALNDALLHDLRVDVLLAAGDLPWDHLESLASAVDAPAAYVPGNHDPQTGVGTASGPRGFVNLDGQVLVVGGLRIAGLGGSVRYNSGAHQYTQKQYARRARKLLRSARRMGPVDLLLTHAPPLGLGDEPDPSHVGISALHGVLETLQPRWHLHGHIHPYGMHKPDRQVGPTTVRNVIPWQLIEVAPHADTSTAAGAGRRA
ncbi:MAG: metallophosphoesterase [Flavobacterium sp.]|nr:metallophosphoesterase [Aeromicrobium sp.]